jgi:hypothetical protein
MNQENSGNRSFLLCKRKLEMIKMQLICFLIIPAYNAGQKAKSLMSSNIHKRGLPGTNSASWMLSVMRLSGKQSSKQEPFFLKELEVFMS